MCLWAYAANESCPLSSAVFFSTRHTCSPDRYQSRKKCFFHKNGNPHFQYVVFGYADTYFVQGRSDAPQKYSKADVEKMLEYLINNIFVEFGGQIFQQIIGISMGTNCAPLLANLFSAHLCSR